MSLRQVNRRGSFSWRSSCPFNLGGQAGSDLSACLRITLNEDRQVELALLIPPAGLVFALNYFAATCRHFLPFRSLRRRRRIDSSRRVAARCSLRRGPFLEWQRLPRRFSMIPGYARRRCEDALRLSPGTYQSGGVLFSTQSFERFEITVREPCTIAAISDRQSEVWRLRADFENPLVSPAKLTW